MKSLKIFRSLTTLELDLTARRRDEAINHPHDIDKNLRNLRAIIFLKERP